LDLARDGDRDPLDEAGEGVLETKRTGDLVEDLERDLDLAVVLDTDRDLDLAGDLDLAVDLDTDRDLDLDRESLDTDLDLDLEFSDGASSFNFFAFGGPVVSSPFDFDTAESFLAFSHSLSFSSSRFLITW